MRTLTQEDISIVEFIIKEDAVKEATEILEKCSDEKYEKFMKYHNEDQGNICCLVLDAAKDELVESGVMFQKKNDYFGFYINL